MLHHTHVSAAVTSHARIGCYYIACNGISCFLITCVRIGIIAPEHKDRLSFHQIADCQLYYVTCTRTGCYFSSCACIRCPYVTCGSVNCNYIKYRCIGYNYTVCAKILLLLCQPDRLLSEEQHHTAVILQGSSFINLRSQTFQSIHHSDRFTFALEKCKFQISIRLTVSLKYHTSHCIYTKFINSYIKTLKRSYMFRS